MGTRKPAEEGKLTVLASGPGRERLGDVFEPVAAKVDRPRRRGRRRHAA